MPTTKKALIKRLDYTCQYLTEQSNALKDKIDQFDVSTCSLVQRIVKRKRRVLSNSLLRAISTWWRWFLVLKDLKLELYNGVLRHKGVLNRGNLEYKNNFDMREERYYNNKKIYSGVALDDLRGGLKITENLLSDSRQERYQLVYNCLDETLDSQSQALVRFSGAVVKSLSESFSVALNKIRFLELDLEECLICEGIQLKLTRPNEKGSKWVSDLVRMGISGGEGSSSEDSDSDQIDTKKRNNGLATQRKKSRTTIASSCLNSSDSEIEDVETEGLNYIKRLAGKNPDQMSAQFDAVQEEESRTVRTNTAGGMQNDQEDNSAENDSISAMDCFVDHLDCGYEEESKNNWEDAIDHYKKYLLSLNRSLSDSLKRCVALRRIGVCSSFLESDSSERQDTTLAYLMSSVDEAVRMNDFGATDEAASNEIDTEVERSTTELGNYMMYKYENEKNFDYLDQAAAYYQSSYELSCRILQSSDSAEGEAKSYSSHEQKLDAAARAAYNLGRCLAQVNAYSKAEKLLNEAITFSAEISSTSSEEGTELVTTRAQLRITYFKLLGEIHMKLQNFKDAVACFSQALSLLSAQNNTIDRKKNRVFNNFDEWPRGDLLFNLALSQIYRITCLNIGAGDDNVNDLEVLISSAKSAIINFQNEIDSQNIKMNGFVSRRIKELGKELRSALEKNLEASEEEVDRKGEEGEGGVFEDGEIGEEVKSSKDMVNNSAISTGSSVQRGEEVSQQTLKKSDKQMELNLSDFGVDDTKSQKKQNSDVLSRNRPPLVDSQQIRHVKKKVVMKQSRLNHFIQQQPNLVYGAKALNNSSNLMSSQSKSLRNKLDSGILPPRKSPATLFNIHTKVCSWQSSTASIPVETIELSRHHNEHYPSLTNDYWANKSQVLFHLKQLNIDHAQS